MANTRKDNRGRVLRKGESFRSSTGMYQYTYTDKFGKCRYLYAKNLVALRQKEEDILRDRLDGIDSCTARMLSLNDLFDKYIATRTDLEERTLAGYLYQYNAYVRPALGKRLIKDIRYSDVLSFYELTAKKHKLSYGSIEHLHREINPVFETAVRDYIIRTNPAHKVLTEYRRRNGAARSIRKALTPEQQERFLKFMEGHPVYAHWRPIYAFFLGTGVRVGELCGLRWCDIDFENGYINIDHALKYFAGRMNKTEKRLFITKPKTDAGIRKIPLIKDVRKALEEIKNYQRENGIYCMSVIDGYTDFVFLNRFGNVYIQTALDRALERIIEAYNEEEICNAAKEKRKIEELPYFTCHNLRHTFCTRFCEVETNVKVIQAVMGHTDIHTTMNIYAEVSENRKKVAMEDLSEKLEKFF